VSNVPNATVSSAATGGNGGGCFSQCASGAGGSASAQATSVASGQATVSSFARGGDGGLNSGFVFNGIIARSGGSASLTAFGSSATGATVTVTGTAIGGNGLNAFLNAARSVGYLLERDKAWIGSWEAQRTKAEEALQTLMTDMRDASVHDGRTETTVRSYKVPIIIAPPNPSQVHARRAYVLSLQGSGPWTTSDVHYVQLNGSEQEAVAACEQYEGYLTKFVQDFIDKHPE
jgi:hypothetical protein